MNNSIANLRSHRLKYDSFRRTPNGLIFTEDLKTVYSVFLICLNLKSKENETKKLFSSIFTKTSYSYSFSLKTAINRMKNLEIPANSNTTCVHVSYSIKDALAKYLLVAFMEAKLLHTPADRTRNEPKDKVLLQPTPKGVAILTKYCKDIGLKKIPDILISNLNSITLFTFERSSITDSLIHSDKLLHILLTKIMGEKPNVWKPNMNEDKLPTLSELLENNNDIFTFENAIDYFNGDFPPIWPGKNGDNEEGSNTHIDENDLGSNEEDDGDTIWVDQIPETQLMDIDRKSPLSHKYFTNPDSDSHIQYYASDTGLRLFYNKQFMNPSICVRYCFTSKVLWQWLMDCTDILYPKEAITLSALFLKIGLLCPILSKPSNIKSGKFCISRSSFFTLSSLGWDLVNWNQMDCDIMKREIISNKIENVENGDDGIYHRGKIIEIDINSNESNSTMVSTINESDLVNNKNMNLTNLEDILSDPGMRYLFRKHLEKEFCVENLDVYIMIKKFLKRMTILKKFIDNNKGSNGGDNNASNNNKKNKNKTSGKFIRSTIDSALSQQANECLEMAFQIYSCYIMIGAPYQLNLDHHLREEIGEVILNPKSPIKEYFNSNEIMYSRSRPNKIGVMNDKPNLKFDEIKLPSQAYIPRSNMGKSITRDKKPGQLYVDTTGGFNVINGNDDYKKISETLLILKQLYPLFEEVGIIMYKLMEMDSLPKFYNSKEYLEIK